ncbi:MAG: hypothetical protein ACKPKO_12290, partial [Candidatus Fonsibacter sp.]
CSVGKSRALCYLEKFACLRSDVVACVHATLATTAYPVDKLENVNLTLLLSNNFIVSGTK